MIRKYISEMLTHWTPPQITFFFFFHPEPVTFGISSFYWKPIVISIVSQENAVLTLIEVVRVMVGVHLALLISLVFDALLLELMQYGTATHSDIGWS